MSTVTKRVGVGRQVAKDKGKRGLVDAARVVKRVEVLVELVWRGKRQTYNLWSRPCLLHSTRKKGYQLVSVPCLCLVLCAGGIEKKNRRRSIRYVRYDGIGIDQLNT